VPQTGTEPHDKYISNLIGSAAPEWEIEIIFEKSTQSHVPAIVKLADGF
jgi:hypothetical protein